MNSTVTTSLPTLVSATATGSIIGAVVGPLLIACFRVIAERIIPYIRSGAFSRTMDRLITSEVHPLREILPRDLPHEVYEGIIDLSKSLYIRCTSCNDIVDGCRYVTLSYIYKIRLKMEGEVISNTCIRVNKSSPPRVHEFHSKVIKELRSSSDELSREVAKLLSKWLIEGRVRDYSCGDTMMYEVIHASRPVVIEISENPLLEEV